ncbi:hypothetical protein [Roseimaritima sediminicola]|uniref:hypothetical protein n=1 Tax=Roseimaritima sediminicola TaxID=2662066 RepID=UPI0012984E77|nr:hypothetical protein [Roseimaritima sediminicola]
MSSQRIHQDLVAEHGFEGKYWSVNRFVRSLRKQHELPFRRMEVEPGEELQVDFGTGAKIRNADGTYRRTHVFRCVLSQSRKGYSEAVYKDDPTVFFDARPRDGLPYASPVQVFLECSAGDKREQETAQQVMDRILGELNG